MKHAYAVLVLMLVLVFALGSSASAGIIRGENYDNVDGGLIGNDGGDEDHPWGGDRVTGYGGDEVGDKYVRPLNATGFPILDLMITSFVKYFTSEDRTVSQSPTYRYRLERRDYRWAQRPGFATTVNSRDRMWKVAR